MADIKNGQLTGIKFRRQESIGSYITDFYSHSEKLIIELDAEQHFTEEGKEYDCKRTEYFNSIGLREIKFENQIFRGGWRLELLHFQLI